MSARPRFGVFEKLAVLAVVMAAAACGVTAFVSLDAAVPASSPTVKMERRAAAVKVVRDGQVLDQPPSVLAIGDRVEVVSGRPTIHVSSGVVELSPGAALEVQVPLQLDRAHATVRGAGLRLDLRGVTAVVDGVARIDRGYSTVVSVLSGRALVETLGRTLPLTALHQVVVPAAGVLPTSGAPMGSDALAATAGTRALSALGSPATPGAAPEQVDDPAVASVSEGVDVPETPPPAAISAPPSGEPLVPGIVEGVTETVGGVKALLGELVGGLFSGDTRS